MAVDNKEQTSVIVEDPMMKHLEKVSHDPDWQYFGLKKKDVSAQISKDLTHWIEHDAIPHDMIAKIKVQIEMIKAMINTDYKKTVTVLETKQEEDEHGTAT